jgi:hypothetical protein
MSVLKINGGIVSSQALTGSLKYFKMVGNFNYTVSNGTVTLPPATSGGSTPTPSYNLVGINDPVPNSLASLALNAITARCTIVEIGLKGTPAATTEIHFAAENTSFGWINDIGEVDTAAMVAAVAALGATVTVPTTSGGAVDDNTVPPATASVSTTVTITQVPFLLV